MQTALVTDGRTLRALHRAGYVVWQDGFDRHWTGLRARRRFVQPGPRLEAWYQEFCHRGRRYRLTYVDGCFCPFVMRLDNPSLVRPAFV